VVVVIVSVTVVPETFEDELELDLPDLLVPETVVDELELYEP